VYGLRINSDARKIKLGQYLFKKHGGKVVFFGRFVRETGFLRYGEDATSLADTSGT